MAITKNVGRQEVIAAVSKVSFGTGQMVDAAGLYAALDLPDDAIVVGGSINVTAATSAGVTVSLGDSGSATRYASAVSAAAAARTALTLTGFEHTAPTTLNLTVAGTPVTVGSITLVVEYVVIGRAAFSQG